MEQIKRLVDDITTKDKYLFVYLLTYLAFNKRDETLDNLIEGRLITFPRHQVKFINLIALLKEKLDENPIDLISKIDKVFEYDIEQTTNTLINHLASEILSLTPGDEVLDLCSGVGSFLTTYASYYGKNHTFFGQEIDFDSALINRIKLFILNVPYDIRIGDVIMDNQFIEDNQFKQFNKIFSNFPFYIKNRSDFDYDKINQSLFTKTGFSYDVRASTDWLFNLIVMNMLDNEGKAVVLMTEGALFKQIDLEIRKQFVDNGYIEAIIKLPRFASPLTANPLHLVLLSHHNESVKLLDLTHVLGFQSYQVVDLLNHNKSPVLSVSLKDIKDNDYNLRVETYLHKEKLNLVNPTPLGELVEVISRGTHASRGQFDMHKIEDPEKPHFKLLKIGDLDTMDLDLLEMLAKDEIFFNYKLEIGDIVISSRTKQFKTALIKDEDLVASGNLIFIRVNKAKLKPEYLKLFLDSDDGQLSLERINTGSVISSINVNSLLKMDIAYPNLEIQDAMVLKYNSYMKEKEALEEELDIIDNKIKDIYNQHLK